MSLVGALVGLLVATVPDGPAVAEAESCDDRLTEQLACWAEVIKDGPVVITLDAPLAYENVDERQRHDIQTLRDDRHSLVVQVRGGKRTGEGGTALLVLAEGRLVHPEARIDRLRPGPLDELKDAGLCAERGPLCELIERKDGRPETLDGQALIDAGLAADHSTHVDALGPVPGGASDPSRREPSPAGPKSPTPGREAEDTPDGEASGYGGSTWTAFWMALLLALLLLAFVIVIRRSRGPVAVGHRAASPGRVVGGPARAAPAHAARVGGAGGVAGGGEDERTTRLRIAPAPRHGRQVGARPAHARTAVVRTELHPQGYVEIDRVLRRAVWAEPGRPPPAPGQHVDVTDARERDSDVLYAFPPTAARHAKGTPR
ncbi:hypothetical protein [Streptomyces sp. NPDC012510]|uniref:hypothetical protein n=1 Tax=Streptomyces sp. NPDC012510 TaxID=3364838 RepID=UPI0036EAABF6